MTRSVIQDKSFEFAVRIVRLYKYLIEKRVYVLARQVLRSGTSIGANVAEAVSAQSKKDFVGKIYIALKEAKETSYWLRLLKETDYLEQKHFESIYEDCLDLIKMMSKTILTLQKNETK